MLVLLLNWEPQPHLGDLGILFEGHTASVFVEEELCSDLDLGTSFDFAHGGKVFANEASPAKDGRQLPCNIGSLKLASFVNKKIFSSIYQIIWRPDVVVLLMTNWSKS